MMSTNDISKYDALKSERVKERDTLCVCLSHTCVRAMRAYLSVSAMRACRTRHRPPLTVRRRTPGGGGAITGGSASRQVNRRTGLFFVRRAITIGSRSLSSVPIVFHRRRRLSWSVRFAPFYSGPDSGISTIHFAPTPKIA